MKFQLQSHRAHPFVCATALLSTACMWRAPVPAPPGAAAPAVVVVAPPPGNVPNPGAPPAPLAPAYANPLAEKEGWAKDLRITAGVASVRAFEQPLREAAAMARVPLAGTSWVPGQGAL